MSKLSEIIAGWKNFVFANPRVEKLAIERIKICVDCDDLRANNTCSLCNCYMPAKVRSPRSRCKIKKW